MKKTLNAFCNFASFQIPEKSSKKISAKTLCPFTRFPYYLMRGFKRSRNIFSLWKKTAAAKKFEKIYAVKTRFIIVKNRNVFLESFYF